MLQQKYTNSLRQMMLAHIDKHSSRAASASGKLAALSPTDVLKRGYSITRRLDDGRIVRSSGVVARGKMVEITLLKGRLICRVEEK